jgi:murein DD-endopeptidase MepM/ murein hydrolase activator NlpD
MTAPIGARVGTAVLTLVAAGLLGTALALPGDAAAWKFGQRTLKPHMRGKDVRVLQRSLTRLKQPTPADGVYGKGTYKSVRRLERAAGWLVDGRVGRGQAKQIKRMIRAQRARKLARRRAAPGEYRFPVGDPHNFGGPQSRFGAARSGHQHQGQDVFAPCRTPLYAAQAGTVKVSSYQASAAGYYLVIDGSDGTDTVYMQIRKSSWAPVGTPLYPGQQIGRVGESGNASGCHLHFEHWTAPGWYEGGYPYDPLPELLEWDSYS